MGSHFVSGASLHRECYCTLIIDNHYKHGGLIISEFSCIINFKLKHFPTWEPGLSTLYITCYLSLDEPLECTTEFLPLTLAPSQLPPPSLTSDTSVDMASLSSSMTRVCPTAAWTAGDDHYCVNVHVCVQLDLQRMLRYLTMGSLSVTDNLFITDTS